MNGTVESIAVALGLGLLLVAGPSGAAGIDEKKEICAAAQKRYQAMGLDKGAKPGTVTVLQYKYTFCPWDLTVKAGTTVRWINVDKRTSHSVWFKAAGKKESVRLFPEESWKIKLMEPGVYPYLCGPHWESENMKGTLRVVR